MLLVLIAGLVLVGCGSSKSDGTDGAGDETGSSWTPAGCGDGEVADDEACDDGAANSDTEPGACRTDCLLPTCGDGVTDPGEACDDGATWGGDGCGATCAVETGVPEVEPNDTWDAATPVAPGEVDGALPAGDVDCWSVEVPSCGAVRATQAGDCSPAVVLSLHDPTGALVASGAPGDDGCAVLDPVEAPGARWIGEGTWSVCVEAVQRAEVRGYSLTIETPDPLTLDAPPVEGDLDSDGVPDSCDGDRDGDGLADGDDNCPDVSNGPDTEALTLSADGYVRSWLSAGPYTTGATTGDCRPSDDAFVGEDDVIVPTIGDPAGELMWTAWLLATDAFDLLGPYGSVPAPREAYTLVYLYSEEDRPLTLAIGADDGLFAWWNGVKVLDVSSCQGVNADQFQADVDVLAGWNTLLLKIRDQGGGWGGAARLLDGGVPVTDLAPSLRPDEVWIPDQTDSDGDRVGDVCDGSP